LSIKKKNFQEKRQTLGEGRSVAKEKGNEYFMKKTSGTISKLRLSGRRVRGGK